jgi:rRNA-processing protein FCF1
MFSKITTSINEVIKEVTNQSKKKIIFDTNVLLLPGSEGVDIFSGVEELVNESVELCVMKGTLEELENIIEKKTSLGKDKKVKGKDSFNAKLGFIMCHQKKLRQLGHQEGHVDDSIVLIIKEGDYVVTLDRVLQRRVLAKKGKVIGLRQKRLVLIEK